MLTMELSKDERGRVAEAVLKDRVLEALAEDEGVIAALALDEGGRTFVVGCRDTGDSVWGRMMFVIALEARTEDRMGSADHGRLQELKEGISAHSSIEGTAWFGMARTLRTAMRISRGEAQLEPSEGP